MNRLGIELSVSDVRKRLHRFGVSTTLTDDELSSLIDFQATTGVRDIAIVGKAGSGKDTSASIIMEMYPGQFGTDNMAEDLKKGALITFQAIQKDRQLLQGLSTFRTLLSSCYLDNVWRRILYRRTLSESELRITRLETPNDVVNWWRQRLFPYTSVTNEQIEGVLQYVYDDRFGDGGKWWSRFQPMDFQEEIQPLKSVILTDCRFPNEFLLAYSLGLRCLRVICDLETRIERLRRRDGSVDPSRLSHESEIALDFIYDSLDYQDVVCDMNMIDNNGTIEDTRHQIKMMSLGRVV